MRVLFDDVVIVAFHSFWIVGDDEARWDTAAHGGQSNGLCGAAEPGTLSFITGLHTGPVPVRVEAHGAEPPVEPEWQEVVEASFAATGSDVVTALWQGPAYPLALEAGDHRVRYCAVGFDNENDEVTDPPERYLVQFWPAPPAPDRVVRQTSDSAAYWHREARQTAPPPTAQERADTARRERAERERQEEQWRREDEARYWGGRAPDSDRLRAVAPRAVRLAARDRDLVDEIAAAAPPVQRAMAAWGARRACAEAGLAEAEWVVQALGALDRGDPPPPWFATFDAAFAHWRGVPQESITHQATVYVGEPREPVPIDPEILAIHAVVTAREDDPLVAALDAVCTAVDLRPDLRSGAIASFRLAFGLPPAR